MIFLKLGGSLITDKAIAESARLDVMERLAAEIVQATRARPTMRLLIGHGSGSFGHHMASVTKTHLGARTPDDWLGFAAVWASANRLNRLVMDSLVRAGLPTVSFPPSASAVCESGEIVDMALSPIQEALRAGLVPVVQGDVAFDRDRGSTIVSTEKVFSFLATHLQPARVLLAGTEPGVFSDYPAGHHVMPVVSDGDVVQIELAGSAAEDVTGGMADKVRRALALSASHPQLEIRIFSAEAPGALLDALLGGRPGTLVRSQVSNPTDAN